MNVVAKSSNINAVASSHSSAEGGSEEVRFIIDSRPCLIAFPVESYFSTCACVGFSERHTTIHVSTGAVSFVKNLTEGPLDDSGFPPFGITMGLLASRNRATAAAKDSVAPETASSSGVSFSFVLCFILSAHVVYVFLLLDAL